MVRYINQKNQNGFTLIELIISLAVWSIVLILVIAIFFTGIKVYKDNYDKTEILQQGNAIMDFMTSIIMSSNGIETIENEQGNTFYETNNKIRLGKIELKDMNLNSGESHMFTIQEDPKVEGCSIRYGRDRHATIEVGNYIKSIYTESLPREDPYSNAKGINFTIEMKKGKSTISFSKNIYFRKH